MTGARRALVRLLLLQASWTYERMQGLGLAYASLPLLEPLRTDPDRYRGAVARSAEYFNAHPGQVGVAAGAAARAELAGTDPAAVRRLKTALAGPLGALGDQLFWIGVVPAVVGAMLAGVALGGGVAAVEAGVGVYAALRVAVTAWGLRLGLATGLEVSRALRDSGLQAQLRRVGHLAGLTVGLALPLVTGWFAGALPGAAWAGLAGAVLGLGAGLVRRRLPSARRITVLAIGVAILWHWGVG